MHLNLKIHLSVLLKINYLRYLFCKLKNYLGPSNSHSVGVTDAVLAGADIVRLNMSHQNQKWHTISIQCIRQAGNEIQKFNGHVLPLGVTIDLRGPEIRTGLFKGDIKSMVRLLW